ncbi:MAG: hypothetical protein NT155_03700 [Candidatus Staskawiczbacteria bacterium]|nr:hypothetical protein [Candidatus Staskawiczbacteria bacterium]
MSINWPKLVNQGRAKAIGVSWTEEEAVAISKCAPAEREALIAELRGQPSGKVEGQVAQPTSVPATPAPVKVKKPRVKK